MNTKEIVFESARIAEVDFRDPELLRRDDGEVRTYTLTPKPPFNMVYLLFTPIGIVIGGDRRFGNPQAEGPNLGRLMTSKQEFSEEWFAAIFSNQDYLASKFIGSRPADNEYERLDLWEHDFQWLLIVQQAFSKLYPTLGTKRKARKKGR